MSTPEEKGISAGALTALCLASRSPPLGPVIYAGMLAPATLCQGITDGHRRIYRFVNSNFPFFSVSSPALGSDYHRFPQAGNSNYRGVAVDFTYPADRQKEAFLAWVALSRVWGGGIGWGMLGAAAHIHVDAGARRVFFETAPYPVLGLVFNSQPAWRNTFGLAATAAGVTQSDLENLPPVTDPDSSPLLVAGALFALGALVYYVTRSRKPE